MTQTSFFIGLKTYDNLEAIKRKEDPTTTALGEAAIDEEECLPVVNNAKIKTEEQPRPQPRPQLQPQTDQCERHNRRNTNEWILTNDTLGLELDIFHFLFSPFLLFVKGAFLNYVDQFLGCFYHLSTYLLLTFLLNRLIK